MAITVTRRENENIEDLLKRFARKRKKAGIDQAVREHRHYETRGQRRRRKHEKAMQRKCKRRGSAPQ